MAKATKKLEPGARVRTNAVYARVISRVPRAGTLEKCTSLAEGLWRVRVDGIDGAWLIHANFLEEDL